MLPVKLIKLQQNVRDVDDITNSRIEYMMVNYFINNSLLTRNFYEAILQLNLRFKSSSLFILQTKFFFNNFQENVL